MHALMVIVGTMCLTILLLVFGNRLAFTAWANHMWDSSRPVESMVFDELVLFTLLPFALIVGTVVATSMARSRAFVLSMVGTLPVFFGVIILRHAELVSMTLYLISYTVLCFWVVRVTNQLWASKRGVPRDST